MTGSPVAGMASRDGAEHVGHRGDGEEEGGGQHLRSAIRISLSPGYGLEAVFPSICLERTDTPPLGQGVRWAWTLKSF